MISTLLELREKLAETYGKYELYIRCCCKFLLSFFVFYFINLQIGTAPYLRSPLAAVILAAICIFLPGAALTLLMSAFIVIHLCAISLEAGTVTAIGFTAMLILYFIFKPKYAVLMAVTTLACLLNISGIVAVPVGLLCGPLALIPVIYGMLAYGMVLTVKQNYTVLETAADRLTSMEKIVYFINAVITNERLILLIIALLLTALLVYGLRWIPYSYAWAIAIAAGVACYVLAIMIGNVVFGVSISILYMSIAAVGSVAVSVVIHLVYFMLDGAHSEYLQYEDEDYVYYVKAIPKYSLAKTDKQIKKITGRDGSADDSENINFIDEGMTPDDYFHD